MEVNNANFSQGFRREPSIGSLKNTTADCRKKGNGNGRS